MIIFDQNEVEQADTVILSAATCDGIFFQQAKSGRRFASIENLRLGPLHRIYELSRQSGNARESLRKIKGNTLGREQRRRRPADFQQSGSLLHAVTVFA